MLILTNLKNTIKQINIRLHFFSDTRDYLFALHQCGLIAIASTISSLKGSWLLAIIRSTRDLKESLTRFSPSHTDLSFSAFLSSQYVSMLQVLALQFPRGEGQVLP
jgi:hypothetical protein